MNQHEEKHMEIKIQTNRKKLFLSVLSVCLLGGAFVLFVTLAIFPVLGLAGSWMVGFLIYGFLILESVGFLQRRFPLETESVDTEEKIQR